MYTIGMAEMISLTLPVLELHCVALVEEDMARGRPRKGCDKAVWLFGVNISEGEPSQEDGITRKTLGFTSGEVGANQHNSAQREVVHGKKRTEHEHVKGGLWTEEEHNRFLAGLEKFGKGKWKEISRAVKTRTPMQVATHAQKYFLRQGNPLKKRKPSIFHSVNNDPISSAIPGKTSLPMQGSEELQAASLQGIPPGTNTHHNSKQKIGASTMLRDQDIQPLPVVLPRPHCLDFGPYGYWFYGSQADPSRSRYGNLHCQVLTTDIAPGPKAKTQRHLPVLHELTKLP